MSKVTATLTVNFGSDSAADSGGLLLEVDDRETGLNGGNTSFRPGDNVAYLLYKSDGVSVTEHVVTAGGRAAAGSGSRAVDEVLQFADSKEASLRYPAAGAVSFSWLGRSGGDPRLVGQQTVALGAPGIGLLRAQYHANFDAYRLSGVPTEIAQVLIFVAGERT